MNCSKIKNQLADYLRDNLDPSARAMVEEHLGSCFDCAKELSFLKTYYQSLQSLPKLEAPANFGESVRERLTKQSVFSRFTFAIPAKVPGLIGALTVIVLLLLIVYPSRFHQTPSIQPSTASEISKPAPAPLALETKEETGALQDKLRAVAKPDLKRKKLNLLTITLLVKLPLPASTSLGQDRISSCPSSSKGADLFESESKKSVADENLTESAGGSGFMEEKDSAPVSLPDPITKLKEILNLVNGNLIKEKYHNETNLPEELLLQIPASNYHLFLEQLSLVGEIKKTSPEPTSATEQTVELHFEFQ